MKIANIAREIVHIFTLSLEDTFSKKPKGGQIDPLPTPPPPPVVLGLINIEFMEFLNIFLTGFSWVLKISKLPNLNEVFTGG